MVPHTIVPIIGDGACLLFRAIAYIIYYDTQVVAREIREEIVDHVMEQWDDFSIMSYDRNGNNFNTSADYYPKIP
ncbi:unnamed protein product [Parnassius apollo]|uniref:(apollo) hypothetical protein n=1 Tax=Parnassius apollo TaxID=110799 RepID=A0A8S3WYM4_PARAO|nr:unnamed protein product [Parnassius apollo]